MDGDPNSTRAPLSFEPTQSSETYSSLPEVQIPVTEDDPENTETPDYNTNNTLKMPNEPPTAEPETSDEMVEADEETEKAWNPRSAPGSESSDGEFCTSKDIMMAVQTLGTQVTNLAETVSNLQTQNAQQSAVIFELRSQVQQLTQELKT